ncbi:Pr6Pr family membrane protein [Streptosporangium sp. KLBMP 9127]|nr:Pr6Pr family membrane protein [Streptosporangium sp. KLBMP 9127]
MRVTWRILLVVMAVVGLVCNWATAAAPLNPPVYFTVQSNLALVLYYGWRLLGRDTSATLKGAVTLYLVITGLVAHFVLTGGANPLLLFPDGSGDDVRDLGSLLLHYVTPIMALADWLLFDRSRRLGWTDPLKWLAYPLAYAVFALGRGALLAPGTARRYPYPFLDVDRLGYDGVAVQAVVLAVVFAVLGYALIALRRIGAPAAETVTAPS